jgi:hypothetical protein
MRLDTDNIGKIVALQEVYYDDDGKPDGFCSAGKLYVEIDETIEEDEKKILEWLKKALLDAFDNPVLNPEDILGYKGDIK